MASVTPRKRKTIQPEPRDPTTPEPSGEKERLRRLLAESALRRPQDAAGFWLWRAAHTYQREMDRALKPFGLTHLQYIILVEIAWFGSRQDEVTQKDIVSLGTIHLAQVSAVVKKLQENQLVDQRRSGRDSRSRVLRLTETGFQALQAALPAVARLQRSLFGAAPAAETPLVAMLSELLGRWR